MRLVKSKAEYLPQDKGLEGAYKQIEIAGRTCYKSEDRITENSAKKFFDRMYNSKHLAMLEHGTLYFNIRPDSDETQRCIDILMHNPYSVCVRVMNDEIGYAITTNFRVVVENYLYFALAYLCEPTEYHEKRYTMKFITDRGVSLELIRHRVFSFAQESTRYCNYSREKFGSEITFIIPSWCSWEPVLVQEYEKRNFKNTNVREFALLNSLLQAEQNYLTLLSDDCSPQQARQVLPNALKTEIVMTGFSSQWKHFFDLRLYEKTGAVHPDMFILAEKAQKALEEAGVWEDIEKQKSIF